VAVASLSVVPPLPLPPLPPILPPPIGGGPQPGPAGHQRPKIRAATTGRHSERIRTLPITRRRGASPRAALSLRLPGVRTGRRVRLSAEVQASTTCPPVQRATCIGRPYSFNPTLTSRLVLADSPRAVGGRHADTVSRTQRVVCHQRPPNRNHHCVFVFGSHGFRAAAPRRRPCRSPCYANLVLAAHNRHARPGQVVVLGGDRPSGRVVQGRARLNALVLPRGAGRRASRIRDRRLESPALPTGAVPSNSARVLYSVELPRLRRGDRVLAAARSRVGIGGLPYNAYVHSQVIVARSPTATAPDPLAARSAILDGDVTPGNGFNCTRGRSAYRTPCRIRKAGLTVIKRTPRTASGRRVPLYVNLVSRAKALLLTPSGADRLRALPRGHLKVVRMHVR
jgi:hypothetical protein